uniref:WGS project CAEQ00000000 data, annotated contig 1888 n=1 Tax=Trypanosoma congolense (strain IL3000) TaxID=1068625 RepID=F9W9R1_TRYCI|nr:unnamed protein product [Trypanosoma congolense IL3000]
MALSSGSFPNFFPSLNGSNMHCFPDDTLTPLLSMRYEDGFMDPEPNNGSPSSMCNTPSFRFHNGLAWVENWQLSSSNLLPPTDYSAATGLSRTPSSFSTLRYSHDPYGVQGSSTQLPLPPVSGMIGRAPSPTGCASPFTHGGYGGEAALAFPPGAPPMALITGPPVAEHLQMGPGPRGATEVRGRRRGRMRDRDRGRAVRCLADAPPPTSMRYFPPPPPQCPDSTSPLRISQEALVRIATRWYQRTIACEQSYAGRLQPNCGAPTSMMVMRPQHMTGSLPVTLCPRMEFTPQFTFDHWLRAAGQWWDTVIRPLTAEYRLPPPYGF